MPLYLLVGEDGEWRPEPSGGGPSALTRLGMTWRELSPRGGFFVAPRPIFFVAPTPIFFVAPRRQPRGPSALARLGMTSRDAVPNEVKGLYGNSDSF
jgi:hypothetical protein